MPLKRYLPFLRQNPAYRILLIAELINQLGNWLTYVATLELATRLAPGGSESTAVGFLLLARLLPSAFSFPITGAVADLYDRRKTMIMSCIGCALCAAPLSMLHRPSQFYLFYILLLISNFSEGFYEPARRALVPMMIKQEDLPTATNLDSLMWSVMAAVGSLIGGIANAKLGPSTCFLLDSLTFAMNGVFVHMALVGPRKSPAVAAAMQRYHDEKSTRELVLSSNSHNGAMRRRGDEVRPSSPPPPTSTTSTTSTTTTTPHVHHHPSSLTSAIRIGLDSVLEGASFLAQRDNRDVLLLCFVKSSAGLLWGFAHLVATRFAHLASFQSYGDASTTLGYIFSAVGVGCFFGPLLADFVTTRSPSGYLHSIAGSFFVMAIGFALMGSASSATLLLPASMVRAMGSTVLWAYSTLVIQLRVPNEKLGRVSALELAMYFLAESISSVISGYCFDVWKWDASRACLVAGVLGGGMAAGWALFATRMKKRYDVMLGGGALLGEDNGGGVEEGEWKGVGALEQGVSRPIARGVSVSGGGQNGSPPSSSLASLVPRHATMPAASTSSSQNDLMLIHTVNNK